MVVDHARTTTLAASNRRPSNLSQTAGASDNVARIGMTDQMPLQGTIILIAEKRLHICSKYRRLYEDHVLVYTSGV